MYFHYFLIISPWKRAGPFFWTNLNPLYSRMFCAKVWLKLAQWFWRRRFLNFVNVFSLFRYYLPLEKVKSLGQRRQRQQWRTRTNFDQKSSFNPRLRWAKKGEKGKSCFYAWLCIVDLNRSSIKSRNRYKI